MTWEIFTQFKAKNIFWLILMWWQMKNDFPLNSSFGTLLFLIYSRKVHTFEVSQFCRAIFANFVVKKAMSILGPKNISILGTPLLVENNHFKTLCILNNTETPYHSETLEGVGLQKIYNTFQVNLCYVWHLLFGSLSTSK